MIFLLDENFPKSAEKLLYELGHQVIDIRGTELQGIDDFRLFELAQENGAILLTTDRDFYHTVPLRYSDHSGVIVIALKQPSREAILSKLRWIISQDFMGSIHNTIYLLRDKAYRVRHT
jgi:predicted nuclease of predicted toxin-antitoxin system